MATPRYFFDLFAGCGGLSLGLEQAGFTPLLVNEISPDATETYLQNRDSALPWLREKYHVPDIDDLLADDSRDLVSIAQNLREDFGLDVLQGDLDLIAGGPPCQGFSRIGHRRSHGMDRQDIEPNHLYRKMAQIIAILNPRIFLFENVAGLQTAKWTQNGEKGEIWQDVITAFREIPRYRVHPQVVHASRFGVPQNRPRVLIVGIREDIPFIEDCRLFANGYLPAKAVPPPSLYELLSDLIDPDYQNGGETTTYRHPAVSQIQEFLRLDPITFQIKGMGDGLTEHKYSRHSPHVSRRFQSMIENGKWPDHDVRTNKFSQRVLPQTWGPSGPNITVTSLPDDYVHFAQPRTPTVREWARMQTFPDWYVFRGPRTTGGHKRAGNPRNGDFSREVPKYTQIGNAVPVSMARAIGEHFMRLLQDLP